MKRIILLLIICFSLVSANAKIRAYLSYATFYTPSEGPYMETYLSINGKSVKYQKLENGKFQATIEVIFYFEKNDSIKSVQKIELKSPEIIDTTQQYLVDFIDVQRFETPSGFMNFNISIRDINSAEPAIISKEKISINYTPTTVSLSGIQIIDKVIKNEKPISLTKHGYDIYPYLSDFYPNYINYISFYYEVYFTKNVLGENSNYISKYYIEDANSHQKLGQFIKQKTVKSSEIDITFGNFDIKKLPSGNYNLVVEILDSNQKVIAFNSFFFQRSNPNLTIEYSSFSSIDVTNTFVENINNFDTLRLYLDYLYPILDDNETVGRNSILMDQRQNRDSIMISKEIMKKHTLIMQQFFLDFWKKRNDQNPKKAWEDYLSEVMTVNQIYSSLNIKGYLSERGRVYLKYGKPNSINSESMGADSYPYEIWHYYQIKAQGNRKFVFYNVDRVSNNYELLHSDVTGEIHESEWEKILRNRRQNQSDHDTKTSTPVWGDHSRDFWNNPR
jgi:GWxTD domain-containing protein